MSDAATSEVPESLLAAARAVVVPADLRALFERMRVELALELELPAGAAVPDPALQLVRLAAEGPWLRLRGARSVEAEAPLRVRLVHGAKDLTLGSGDLIGGPPALARRIAEALLDPAEAARTIERGAAEASRQDALRQLTRAMLATQSIDRLRAIMLLGLTSGHALGFTRAALFVYDEDGRALVGVSAVGPADETEAGRLWDALEVRSRRLADLLVDAGAGEADQRFEEFVRGIEVDVSADARDEVGEALEVSGPVLFDREQPVNPAIAALGCPREFMVCAIRLRGKPIGVLVADNRYSGAKIDPACLDLAGFLIDMMALASENLRLLESVETLARHDALTGLFNRREFETRMVEEQSRSQRLQSQCGLLLFDVDFMGKVNDARGSKAGDELLQSIGVLLRSTLRTHDIVARIGGDKFAVMITDTNGEQIKAIARRVGSQALGIGVSLSVGGSVWPRENQEFSVLYAEADAALVDAKRRGRGRAYIDGVAEPLVFVAPEDGETPFG